MSKCAATLLLAVLFSVAATWAEGHGVTARVAAADDEADDDDDDDKPAKRTKSKRADDATTDDDDDDDATTDDDKPAKRKKPAKRATDDDDDDATTDDDDDKPAKRKKPAKRATDDEADDDAAAAADDDDDKPAKRTKKRTKRTTPDDDASDDDPSDDAASDGDDEVPPNLEPSKKKRGKRKPTRRAEDAVVVEDTVDIKQAVVPELHLAPPKVTVAGELLGAKPMDSSNSSRFGMGGGGGLGLEYFVSPALGLHASASFMTFTAGESMATSMATTSWASAQAGPRLHFGAKLFGAATHHDAWIDAHASYGSSGGIRRPGFDAGAAILWEISPTVRLGPMVRWAFGSDPRDQNAQLLHVGLAVGLGGRTRQTIDIEGDFDGDGLVDRLDECRDEVPGDKPDPDKPGCPIRDGDDDGIADADDECPDEAMGDTPDPERTGCPKPPVLDRDGDMVPDDVDRCPDQFGSEREDPDTNGCPLARVQDQKIEIFEQIFFEHDSATISDTSRPVLEAIGKVIAELGDARISIEGHTSEDGSDAYNLNLSKRRARAVAQWLIENAGIATARLETKGWGKRRPLVEGFGADISRNRRVEFIILEAK